METVEEKEGGRRGKEGKMEKEVERREGEKGGEKEGRIEREVERREGEKGGGKGRREGEV